MKLFMKISSPLGYQRRFSIFPYLQIASEVKYFKYEILRKIRASASSSLLLTIGIYVEIEWMSK